MLLPTCATTKLVGPAISSLFVQRLPAEQAADVGALGVVAHVCLARTPVLLLVPTEPVHELLPRLLERSLHGKVMAGEEPLPDKVVCVLSPVHESRFHVGNIGEPRPFIKKCPWQSGISFCQANDECPAVLPVAEDACELVILGNAVA